MLKVAANSLVLIFLFLDLALGACWSQWYYTHGIPIVRFRRALPGPAFDLPAIADLEERFTSLAVRGVVFRDFGAHTYGFRRSLLLGSALLNGIVVFAPGQGKFEVYGRLGVFGAGFLACIAISFDYALPLLLIITVLMVVDLISCARIATAVQTVWGKSYFFHQRAPSSRT